MSLTSYNIIQIVNLAINKDINGNAFSPEEYKVLINSHSMKLFMEKLGLTQEYNGTPVSRQGVSISKVNEKSLLPFQHREPFNVSGTINFEEHHNVAFISALIPVVLVGRGYDEVYPYELGDRLGDPITQPTASDPIAVWRTPLIVDIYPATNTQINVYYYSYPEPCDFTITPNGTTLLPEYTSITELEWNDADKIEIAYRMIREAGVNIEKQDAVAYAQQVISSGK